MEMGFAYEAMTPRYRSPERKVVVLFQFLFLVMSREKKDIFQISNKEGKYFELSPDILFVAFLFSKNQVLLCGDE